MDILFDELTSAALPAGKVPFGAIRVGKLDGLTEEVALIRLFEREKPFASTTTQNVDLGLGLRRFRRGLFPGLSTAGSCAHAALLLRGPVSGKSFPRAGFTAALPRLESNPI